MGTRAADSLSVTRRTSSLGSALLPAIAVQLFWLLGCLWSYLIVVQKFGYEGFVLVAPIGAVRLAAVALALVALSVILPRRLVNPADYVVMALFDISFVPFCSFWALAGQPWWQLLLMVTYWGVVLLVTRLPLRSAASYLKGSENVMLVVTGGLVVLGGILIVAGGHLTLRLSLVNVYAVRAVWTSENSEMSGYLFPWLANAVLPLLMVHAWKNRRLSELLVLGFTAYMLYTSTGMKAYLLMPILVVAVLLIVEWRPPSSIVPIGLVFLAGTILLLGNTSGGEFLMSLGLRRALFVPAQLTSVYLEFFAVNPFIRLSDSVLRGVLTYPYAVSVPHLIGGAIGQPDMGANNGLISDGFANFGLVGGLVWAALLGILIRLLRAATRLREHRPEAWAVVVTWPVVLLSSAFVTSLLTHGLLLGLLLAWSLRPEGLGIKISSTGQRRVQTAESVGRLHIEKKFKALATRGARGEENG